MVALSLAHLSSGDAFGASARLPWSIYLWDDYRHPSQIYEILAAVAIFALAWRQPFGRNGNGLNFLLVVALSATARVFLEAFRGDSVIWMGGFRAAQVVGLLVLGGCLWLMRRWVQSLAPKEAAL
jgi:prolipoprotein diacylglyceryltransferase